MSIDATGREDKTIGWTRSTGTVNTPPGIRLPTDQELERLLVSSWRPRIQRVTIIDRRPNSRSSTHPSEVVTCRIETALGSPFGERQVSLLYKYAIRSRPRLWQGLSFEAQAYRSVAAASGLKVPPLIAAYRDDDEGLMWIAYEYVDGTRLSEIEWPMVGLRLAAEWIALFHAHWRVRQDEIHSLGLPRFDIAKIRMVTDKARTWLLRQPTTAGDPSVWLLDQWGVITDALFELASIRDPTVLHGEFYPDNILIDTHSACPVDWESVMIGPAELDLAMLIDCWSAEASDVAMASYASARGMSMDELTGSRLTAATIYVQLERLGDHQHGLTQESRLARLIQARESALQLGLG